MNKQSKILNPEVLKRGVEWGVTRKMVPFLLEWDMGFPSISYSNREVKRGGKRHTGLSVRRKMSEGSLYLYESYKSQTSFFGKHEKYASLLVSLYSSLKLVMNGVITLK